MKILTVIGARPQFIKASVVSKALSEISGVHEILLHTGQHFDSNMSDIFFSQLNIPAPSIHLGINNCSHAEMTGKMLIEIEKAILIHKPDRVLVYGDTNSTLAGALASSKLLVPVAHVEAGLRSFNRSMPEEINRIITDNLSDILFCPTEASVNNLLKEGFNDDFHKVYEVGDVMQDSALIFSKYSTFPKSISSIRENFILGTLHRAENTNNFQRLFEIVKAFNSIQNELAPVVVPLHPRTKTMILQAGLDCEFTIIDPVGYFDMMGLLKHCSLVMTDSGGLQKEAFFFGKHCITLREETEWVELVNLGVNTLVGACKDKIIKAAFEFNARPIKDDNKIYGGGNAAVIISKILTGK